MCDVGVGGLRAQILSDVFPLGLANPEEATRGREAVRDCRGDRMTHSGSGLP